jgi:hypothetical protein
MPIAPPQPKNLRFALTLNLLLPGAGQIYLGQPIWGSVLAVGFLGCFATMLTLFLRAYLRYQEIATSGNILEGDNLEQLTRVFPTGWLIGLLVLSIAIYFAATLGLVFARRTAK